MIDILFADSIIQHYRLITQSLNRPQ